MAKFIIFTLVIVIAGIVFINFRPVGSLTSQQAIEKVKSLPEVKKYLVEVPGGRIDENGSEGDFYLVQVYEIKDGHTATFNWYQVNQKTGEIKAEFETIEK